MFKGFGRRRVVLRGSSPLIRYIFPIAVQSLSWFCCKGRTFSRGGLLLRVDQTLLIESSSDFLFLHSDTNMYKLDQPLNISFAYHPVTCSWKTKPSLRSRQMRRHGVSHTLSINPLNVRSIVAGSILALWGIWLGVRSSHTDIKDISPLLELLLVVLRSQSSICGSVPDLHFWSRSVVAWVHCLCL